MSIIRETLSSHALGLRLLAMHERVHIKYNAGRRVIGEER